jgi:flagellar basal-body rod modification protein FlgD
MAAIGGVGATGATDVDFSIPVADKKSSEVSKDTFLQLLVAQIKNQNPLSPADGVQFLTQLAQFTELEQLTGVRSEVVGLRSDMAAAAAADAEKSGEAKNV